MRPFLNAGFGQPIGRDTLRELKARGWQGVRQDVPAVIVAADGFLTNAIVPELIETGMGAILVLGPDVWHSPIAVRAVVAGCRLEGLIDVAYEVGNELDAMDARAYAQAFHVAEQAIREVDSDAIILTAGTRNVSKEAILWLARVLGSGLVSEQAIVAVHTYRGSHSPDEPLPGYTSRMDEWSAVAQVAAGRRIALTECGWPDSRTSWWPCARPLSEGQVAQYLRRELQIAAQAGAEYGVVYQLGDGGSSKAIDHFGVRRKDGSWKASSLAAKEYTA